MVLHSLLHKTRLEKILAKERNELPFIKFIGENTITLSKKYTIIFKKEKINK